MLQRIPEIESQPLKSNSSFGINPKTEYRNCRFFRFTNWICIPLYPMLYPVETAWWQQESTFDYKSSRNQLYSVCIPYVFHFLRYIVKELSKNHPITSGFLFWYKPYKTQYYTYNITQWYILWYILIDLCFIMSYTMNNRKKK